MDIKTLKAKVKAGYQAHNTDDFIDDMIDKKFIDPSKWENDYRLPKIVATAIFRKLAYETAPTEAHDKNHVDSIMLNL